MRTKRAGQGEIVPKKKTKKKDDANQVHVVISPPRIARIAFPIRGTAPLLMNKFSAKAKQQIKETQEAGSVAKKGKNREAKDFQAMYEAAKHIAIDGWCGIPASAFRAAMISACKTAGFAMTRAKLSIFVEADGFEHDDGTPLVKITKGEPEYSELPVRLVSGVVDIHPRPLWRPGWEATVTVKYDQDQFDENDVMNLLWRVGETVGILEGRPDSKKSAGMGFGLFEIIMS